MIRKMGTSLTQLDREQFPSLLKEIDDPPEKLYIRGALPPEDHVFLCVVGSRKASRYGREVCREIIGGLSGLPVVIVSGLALGIDAEAHQAALAAKITTVAVPGSGLNDAVLYPAQHLSLARKIIKAGGALLSEFEPNFTATRWSFPQRNRIMAGLSHGILIIEAEERSGTLITARLGLEYNREICAVPGSIFSPTSSGANRLIRDGAYPVTSSADVMTVFGLRRDDGNSEQITDELTDEERRLLSLLQEPRSRSDLAAESGLPVHTVNTILSSLELKGAISEQNGVITLKKH